MSDLTLILHNLFRKAVRTWLLIISVAIAFLIFGMLNGFLDSVNHAGDQGRSAERLSVSNKINFTQPLPYAYYQKIKDVDGVADITWANWFGGYFREVRNQIFTFAVDPESYLRVYRDLLVIPEDQKQAFLADRTGIIVGKALADKYGFKVGQALPLNSNIFPNKSGSKLWNFTIRGIFTGSKPTDPTTAAYLHWDYFNEAKAFPGEVIGFITVLPKDPARADQLAKRIDALFANAADETETQSEAAFQRGFLKQLGDLESLVSWVTSAAFFAILMIVANTLYMAVRERTREIGVMKTLGFSSGRILRLVLSESLFVALLGAAIGLGLAEFLMVRVLTPAVKEQFGALAVSPLIVASGFGLALAFGLITGLAPALGAFRLRIVEALGRK